MLNGIDLISDLTNHNKEMLLAINKRVIKHKRCTPCSLSFNFNRSTRPLLLLHLHSIPSLQDFSFCSLKERMLTIMIIDQDTRNHQINSVFSSLDKMNVLDICLRQINYLNKFLYFRCQFVSFLISFLCVRDFRF